MPPGQQTVDSLPQRRPFINGPTANPGEPEGVFPASRSVTLSTSSRLESQRQERLMRIAAHAFLLITVTVATACFTVADAGQVEIAVVDAAGQPLPCRIHLYDNAGKPQRAENLPFFRDHFVCPGNVALDLKPGTYRFEVERGPEYVQHAGTFELAEAETKTISATLERVADLAALGWYSGDLHVHRAIEDMPLLMRAEDLHVAPVITWWNERNLWTERELPEDPLVRLDGNRFYHVMAGEDEREGGALMFFQRTRPLAIAGSSREHPSPMKFVAEARRQGNVWIDERANRVPAKLDDPEKLREVLAHHDQARQFWQEKLAAANAE
ncbi:MAG: hypothetical protein ABIP48_24140 [Planctomycetota bacterium]